jgi:transcriptional regulator with XRE-family HTH domain
MRFGDTLRSLLEERFITQKQMADALNIAPSTLSGYILNSSEPDFETLKKIAKYFDTTTDYLLDYRTGNTDTHQEDNILRIFRTLTNEQREIFTEQSKIFVRINEKSKRIKP